MKKTTETQITKGKINSIWAVAYIPKAIEDLACTEDIRVLLTDCINSGNIPNHLCLYGTPGTGKNSIVNILRSNLDAHFLIINASEENGIDDIRTKVLGFVNSGAFFNKPKIIVMNEADGLTIQAQNSMREIMESKSDSCRFIFTCNSINQIIQPIRSRCSVYQLDPPVKEIAIRLCKILKAENIKFDKGFLLNLIKIKGRDLRKLINEAQSLSKRYKELDETVFSSSTENKIEFFDKIFEIKGIKSIADIVKSQMYDDDIYSVLANYCIEKEFPSQAIPIIADHLYRSQTIFDKDVIFMSCILTLKQLVNK